MMLYNIVTEAEVNRHAFEVYQLLTCDWHRSGLNISYRPTEARKNRHAKPR